MSEHEVNALALPRRIASHFFQKAASQMEISMGAEMQSLLAFRNKGTFSPIIPLPMALSVTCMCNCPGFDIPLRKYGSSKCCYCDT